MPELKPKAILIVTPTGTNFILQCVSDGEVHEYPPHGIPYRPFDTEEEALDAARRLANGFHYSTHREVEVRTTKLEFTVKDEDYKPPT